MDKDTRKVIEESYNQFRTQIEQGTEMTPAGQLMYTMLVALIELDNKMEKQNDGNSNFTFYS